MIQAIIGMSIMTLISIAFAAYLLYKFKVKKEKPISYMIIVKFSIGIKTKLILNAEQYEQFKAWLSQPEGIYQIGNDSNQITLNRIYVAAVEVRQIK